jgi:hypothetical protein
MQGVRLNIGAKILVFGFLIAATAFFLRPLQLFLGNRTEELKNAFISRGEAYLGHTIEYASMGPSVFSALDIRNIRILRQDGSELMTIGRLRLSYSLWNILSGNTAEAFYSIRLDRPVFRLDFEKDSSLSSLFAASHGGGQGEDLSDLLPEGLQLRIRNGAWTAAGTAFQFSLENLGLDASLRGGRVAFQGRWTATGAFTPEGSPGLGDMFRFSQKSSPAGAEPGKPLSLAVNGRINGEYAVDSGEGNAAVTIPLLSGDSFALKPLGFNVLFRNRRLEIRKTYDKSPLSLAMIWDLETDRINASFGSDDFSPQDLVSFSGPWKEYNSMLALKISGHFSLKKEADKGISYLADLSGTLPRRLAGENAGFVFAGRGDGTMIHIGDFVFNSERGNVGFKGDIGFEPLVLNGLLSISGLSLTGEEKISGDIEVNTRGREINFFAENFTAASVTLSALEASVFREDSGLIRRKVLGPSVFFTSPTRLAKNLCFQPIVSPL